MISGTSEPAAVDRRTPIIAPAWRERGCLTSLVGTEMPAGGQLLRNRF